MLCWAYEYKAFGHVQNCIFTRDTYTVININHHFHWQHLFPGFQYYHIWGGGLKHLLATFYFPSSNHPLLFHKHYLTVSGFLGVNYHLLCSSALSPELQTYLPNERHIREYYKHLKFNRHKTKLISFI